jgi:HEAT repeat protein
MNLLRRPTATAVVIAVALALPSLALAQRPDAVAPLRAALRADADPSARDAALRDRVAAMESVAELTRALALAEWRDRDADATLAEVDRRHRTEVARRLEIAARSALATGEASRRLGTLDCLASLATSDGEGRAPCEWVAGLSPDLAALVRSGPPGVRARAASLLGRWHADPATVAPALGVLVRTGKVDERQAAAKALADCVGLAGRDIAASNADPTARSRAIATAQAVVPVAAEGLKDKSALVRRRALDAVAGGAHVLNLLLQASGPAPAPTEDPVPLARAFGVLGASLARALGDPDVPRRLAAIGVAEELAECRSLCAAKGAANRAVADLLDPLLAALAAPLADVLGDADVRVRRAALELVETLGPVAQSAVPAVLKASTDNDPFIRWAAARTLGRLAPAQAATAVPRLTALLDDAELTVRQAAAGALGRFGPAARPAAATLARLTKAKEPELRAAAVAALVRIGPAPSIRPAIAAAQQDPDEAVRRAVAEALEQIEPRPDNPPGVLKFHRGPTTRPSVPR